MMKCKFYTAGHTAALDQAVNILRQQGYDFLPRPDPSVTHLLLPVPGFEADGSIKGGGCLEEILSRLADTVTVLGGNLNTQVLSRYKTIDLLQDPFYIAENANITAHCAVKLAMDALPITMQDCPVLVLGWGRIGKCLARLLRQMGASVTVAARKANDRAMLSALGYEAIDTCQPDTERFRVIFNTAPEMVWQHCPGNALKIDLASGKGLGDADVVWARGLPAKEAPESSGALIARTVIRMTAGKEQTL